MTPGESMPTSKELKPCPFCGGSGHLLPPDEMWDRYGYSVSCASKACAGRTKQRNTEEEAVAAWNERASLSASPEPQGMEQAVEAATKSAHELCPEVSRAVMYCALQAALPFLAPEAQALRGPDLEAAVAGITMANQNTREAMARLDIATAEVARLTAAHQTLRGEVGTLVREALKHVPLIRMGETHFEAVPGCAKVIDPLKAALALLNYPEAK